MGTTTDFYKGLLGTRRASPQPSTKPLRQAPPASRSGIPSRKWLLVVRCLIVAALIAVFANGVLALGRRPESRPTIRTTTSSYPVDAARAYATRFVAAYLSWDVFSPESRATALSAFLPGQQPRAQAGWNGSGRQKVLSATPSAVEIVGASEARIVVDTTLDPGGALCVQTAVRSGNNGSLAVVAYPTAVPCPGIARQPRSAPLVLEPDAAISTAIAGKVTGFMRAWVASSADLAPYVTQDSGISGLGSPLVMEPGAAVSIQVLAWDRTDPTRRQVIAKTTLRTPGGGSVVQAYRVTVRQISGYWLVAAIAAGVDDPDIAPRPADEPGASMPTATSGPSTAPSSPAPTLSAPTSSPQPPPAAPESTG